MNIYNFIQDNFNSTSIIFEIGSHMGLDTKTIYDLTKSKNIHCFEPDLRNINIFNSFNISAKLNQVAVSNIDGEIDFYKSSGNPIIPTHIPLLNDNDWSASSSIKKPKLHLERLPWCKFLNPMKVESIRIDSYCRNNNIKNIDFIWMDVQGAELEVLEGFGKYLNKTKYIYTEYSNEELYENSPNKSTILNFIGDNWEEVYDFNTDILIKNKNYE